MGGSGGGRYIICDECVETTFSLNLSWQHDGDTLRAAEESGWYIEWEKPGWKFEWDKIGKHICPACREKIDGRTTL